MSDRTPLRAQALPGQIPHRGSGERFPTPSSTTVVSDDQGSADRYISGRITIPIEITRYVGDKTKALAEGLLSARTEILFPVYDVDTRGTPCAERDIAKINGQTLGALTGDDGIWRTQRFTINTASLNFPTTPGGVGYNVFTIDIDVNGCNQWLTEVDWVSLKFSAAPPVVFVHGILSEGSTWETFRDYVRSKGVVANNSITLEYNSLDKDLISVPGASCSAASMDTVGRNRDTLVREFKRIAQEYGTEELNVIGHSKGGIDSKAAIHTIRRTPTRVRIGFMNGLPLENRLTVKSLITINTPHLGAPVADLGILNILEARGLAQSGNFKALSQVDGLIGSVIVNKLLSQDHVCDLTLQKAVATTRRYPIQVPAFATGTDAASNPSDARHALSSGDADLVPLSIGASVWNKVYRYTGYNRGLQYTRVTVSNYLFFKKEVYRASQVTGGWRPNDILVTVASAQGGNIPMVVNGLAGQHHTEVTEGTVMQRVTQSALAGASGVKWTVR